MKATDMIMMQNKYLKQSNIDAERGNLVTIKSVKSVNIARDGEPPEQRYAMYFAEFSKPLLLNSTNIQFLIEKLGNETEEWRDCRIVIWIDENVNYGGKRVGGLRLRMPRLRPNEPTAERAPMADMRAALGVTAEAPAPVVDSYDDIPF